MSKKQPTPQDVLATRKNSADFVQDPEDPTKVLYLDKDGNVRRGNHQVHSKLYLQHYAETVQDPEEKPIDHNMEVLNKVLRKLNKTSVFTNRDQYGSALGEVAFNMVWKAGMKWLGIETEYMTENYRHNYDTSEHLARDKKVINGKLVEVDIAPVALEQRSETARMELAYWSNLATRAGNPINSGQILAYFLGRGGSTYEPATEDDLIRATMEITGESYEVIEEKRKKAMEGRELTAAQKDVVQSNLDWLQQEMSRIMRSPTHGLQYDTAPRESVDAKGSYAEHTQGTQGVFSALIQLQDACRKRATATERKGNKDKAKAVLIERMKARETWLKLAKEIDETIGELMVMSNVSSDSYNPLTGILEASMH